MLVYLKSVHMKIVTWIRSCFGFYRSVSSMGIILFAVLCMTRLTQLHRVLCPVSQNARQLLSECVASHLRHKDVALEYGSGLQSSSGRILLQSLPGAGREWSLCFHLLIWMLRFFLVAIMQGLNSTARDLWGLLPMSCVHHYWFWTAVF